MHHTRRLCSACLKAGRETPATHTDLQGRRAYCCDHTAYDEPPLVPGHQCGEDDDSTSDRRPAAVAVIGAMALFGAVSALGWVWP